MCILINEFNMSIYYPLFQFNHVFVLVVHLISAKYVNCNLINLILVYIKIIIVLVKSNLIGKY